MVVMPVSYTHLDVYKRQVVRLDAHVQEASNHVNDVIRVNRSEYQVSCESGLNRDLRRLRIADFSDHDFVRVMAQNRAQAAREGQPLLLVHRNLGDALDLIFDGICLLYTSRCV